MKTLNIKLLIPFFISLFLLGCVPDSLTKFKKDPPKKAEAPAVSNGSSGPVIDPGTGAPVVFTPPTFFFMGSEGASFAFSAAGAANINPILSVVDGSVGDGASNQFKIGCSLYPINAQTTNLPSGLTLNTSTCTISGKPTASKSVVAEFCSDLTSPNQTICESTPQVWDPLTQTCSNKDFVYQTQAACEAKTNKWYGAGSPLPYRVELRYQDSTGAIFNIYATVEIGTYLPLSTLKYTQSDKLLLKVSATPAVLNAIVPVKTTTSTPVGAYLAANLITTQTSVHGIANYVNASQAEVGVKKLVKMTLSNAGGFNPGGFIRASSAAGPVGKIFKKDANNANIVYVENISDDELFFSTGNTVKPNTTYAGFVSTTIVQIDETFLFDSSLAPSMDNDTQFFSSQLSMTQAPTNSYLVNSLNPIKPLKPLVAVLPNNGTLFSTSPKLPAGLVIDSKTGIISGTFLKAMPVTSYTIKATNPLGEVSSTLRLAASLAPVDLNIATKQIITVSSTLFFKENETLFQSITPPLTTAATGKILKILNGNQMAITSLNGGFFQGASLDSGSSFFSEKAFIISDNSCTDTNYLTQTDCEINGYTWSTGPIFYDIALTLSGTSNDFPIGICSDPLQLTKATCEEARIWDTVNALCSDPLYITQISCEQNRVWSSSYVTSTTSGAKGVIAHVFKTSPVPSKDTLFIRHITENALSVSSAKTFGEGDALLGSALTIDEVVGSFLKITLFNNAASFIVGKDATSRKTLAPFDLLASGYIYNKIGNDIFMNDITQSPNISSFKVNETIYSDEFAEAPAIATTITAITHDLLIVGEVGRFLQSPSFVSTGNVLYAISPALPPGLSLNTLTGVISGTPTVITTKKNYVLTASNFIGQSSYVFSMEVRDYFRISNTSSAPSFFLHKAGDTQIDRPCRINARDIINGVGTLDVRCILEAEEEDLHFYPINLRATIGPGVCQFVQYAPYYSWKYPPAQTNPTVSVGTFDSGCNSQVPPTSTQCAGNYVPTGGPNCDGGSILYNEQPTVDTGGGVCGNSGPPIPKLVPCGGAPVNCMVGPVKDLLSDVQLSQGFRSLIYPTPSGFNQTWTFSSPISQADKTNLRVANYTKNNLCTARNADVGAWTTYVNSIGATVAPHGQTTPYYVFNCLDAASQIKARIRLIVRDWDTNYKVDSGIDSYNPPGAIMDTPGTDTFGNFYNRYLDRDDDYDSTGAADYTGGTCAVPNVNTEYRFPRKNL